MAGAHRGREILVNWLTITQVISDRLMKNIPVLPLESKIFMPYGWVLGTPPSDADPTPRFLSAAADFWSAHAFETGPGGQPEMLWTIYRSRETVITSLEAHQLTQQALIPLTGTVVQIVACGAGDSGPDLATLAAFRVAPGRGICMRPGCWHTTRVLGDEEVQCAMLTRHSTTRDLVQHLAHGAPAGESAVVMIPACAWSM